MPNCKQQEELNEITNKNSLTIIKNKMISLVNCSFCGKGIKKGEFIASIGNRMGEMSVGVQAILGRQPSTDPSKFLEEGQNYCKSCFDKQFKKK